MPNDASTVVDFLKVVDHEEGLSLRLGHLYQLLRAYDDDLRKADQALLDHGVFNYVDLDLDTCDVGPPYGEDKVRALWTTLEAKAEEVAALEMKEYNEVR